ncbi:putative quinol monooxygenase [Hyphomicrobium sulfonivorans]|uniref:putative quinol monooxygenase n=1 Tax=Hyphomicrobium sulfonivorans TaxID=121290 RepID=UPI00156F8A82|nr:putative quinol monooxygenase [Hyphomicrobium sulfonivorans]MBI1650336.1 antibiotic biosynthesis monooxygenase [Hyphomicrobium sulfonivorans]
MYVVVVFLEAHVGRQTELRDALRRHGKLSIEREEGCRRYDVSVDPIEGSAFLLYQVYEDEAAYRAHRELPHYADFRLLSDPWVKSRRVLTYESVAILGGP